MMLVLLMITGLLFCLISVSFAVAVELKPSKSLVPMEKKNLSPTTQMSTKEEGTTLFDGTQIIQNLTVISGGMKKLKSEPITFKVMSDDYSSSPVSTERYWEWSLRQLADYLAGDSSRYVIYSLVKTDGRYLVVSNGILGYSKDADLIIGDKYDQYRLIAGVDNVPEYGFEKLDQYRLIIYPDENHLILQKFDSLNPSPSPKTEERISLESLAGFYRYDDGRPNIFYGKSDDGIPSNTIALLPSPPPE